MGDPEFAVRPGDDITVEASLESVDEGIYVTGTASADVHAECSRCLDPVDDHLDVRFDELFSYPEKVPAELEDEDVPVLEGDVIDLGPPFTTLLRWPRPTNLCAAKTARVCAPSAVCVWKTIPTTSMSSTTRVLRRSPDCSSRTTIARVRRSEP